MILVVGSTGLLGGEISRRLAAAGKPVRALVRITSDQAKVDGLKECGAEIVEGDLRDRSSVDAACQGVASVISTVSSMPFSYLPGENDIQTVDLKGVQGLIDAAQAAGIEHFIYTSFSGQIDLESPLRNAKRAVEQHLRESGLTYTILRPSYFTEVWLSPAVGFDYPNGKAKVYGSGENPVSWISYRDVGQFAVDSLDNRAARNAALELGGPDALSALEVVKIFEDASGREFELEHIPQEALEAQRQSSTDGMQQSFAGLMCCVAMGDSVDMQETLKAFPVQLTSVHDYAKAVTGAA
jgi:NADH dehydrogenase